MTGLRPVDSAYSVSGRLTLLAGEFSIWETEAAMELLTDPGQMQSALASAGLPRFLAAHYS